MICEVTDRIPFGMKPSDLAYRLLEEAKVEVEDDGIKEFSNGGFAVALSSPARVAPEAEYKPESMMPDEATRFELLRTFYGAYKDEQGVVNVPNREPGNHHKKPRRKQYRSCLKRHIKNCLTNVPEASASKVCAVCG